MRPAGRVFAMRGPWALAALVVVGQQAATGQPVEVHPRAGSVQDKAPLAWREGDVFYLLNMSQGPRESGGDWALRPMITATWGQPAPGSSGGWSRKRPDGTQLGKIYAFGGSGPTDGTTSVDWGDGSWLRVSSKAAFKYNLPEGAILYSTRLNTTGGYGTRYRIMVFLSKDDGKNWTGLPPVAASAKGPGDAASVVGLWSNFLFERSDGTIQVYYDNELAPWQEPGGQSRGEQWVAMQTLQPGPPLAWSGQANEVIVDGHQPGRPRPRTGMASVSEKPSDGSLILTVEDVSLYEKPRASMDRERFQGVVRVLRSTDGGINWSHVNTLRPDRGYNNLAPYHVRSRVNGELFLVCRTDRSRMDDPANPNYDPYVSARQTATTGNPRWVLGNLDAFRSADDGLTWRPLESAPRTPFRPGGDEFCFDPGLTELLLSPDSSNLVFQWGQFLGGLHPDDPKHSARTWVQTVTIRK